MGGEDILGHSFKMQDDGKRREEVKGGNYFQKLLS